MPEVNPQRAGNGQHEEGLVALHRRDARSRLIIKQALDAIITLDANGHTPIGTPKPRGSWGGLTMRPWAGPLRRRIFPLSTAKTILVDFDGLWKQEKEPC